ncbi:MAG: hypothetical protein CAF44_009085 [Nitrospira sp. CG24D]|nr:MAG: hypothetical protein CAF44_009085 [Nitrospira sp. CG24D]
MKCVSMVKRLAVVAVAAAALAGPATSAHALQFNSGDAVLGVYGNGVEYVKNLGSYQTLITNGLTLDLSSILSQVSPGGQPLAYAIAGYNGGNTDVFFGSRSPIADWTAQNKNQFQPNVLFANLQGWHVNLASAGDTRDFFPKADVLSFSSNLNQSGANTLGGAVPAVRGGFAPVGELMHLLRRTGGPSTLTEVSTAFLSATGQLQIGTVAAVPVPAAVVLFASGLVGLVGLARRRMSGTSQKAA